MKNKVLDRKMAHRNRFITMKEETIVTDEHKTFYFYHLPRVLGKCSNGWDCTDVKPVKMDCVKCMVVRKYSDGRKTIQRVYWKNTTHNNPNSEAAMIAQFNDVDINTFISGIKMITETPNTEFYIKSLIEEFTNRREEALRTAERFGNYVTELNKHIG